MNLTLDLPTDLETRLSAEAARLGLPLEQYALRLLGDQPKSKTQPTCGADVVDFWHQEGIIGSRPDIEDSQVHARDLRRRAERRNVE